MLKKDREHFQAVYNLLRKKQDQDKAKGIEKDADIVTFMGDDDGSEVFADAVKLLFSNSTITYYSIEEIFVKNNFFHCLNFINKPRQLSGQVSGKMLKDFIIDLMMVESLSAYPYDWRIKMMPSTNYINFDLIHSVHTNRKKSFSICRKKFYGDYMIKEAKRQISQIDFSN